MSEDTRQSLSDLKDLAAAATAAPTAPVEETVAPPRRSPKKLAGCRFLTPKAQLG